MTAPRWLRWLKDSYVMDVVRKYSGPGFLESLAAWLLSAVPARVPDLPAAFTAAAVVPARRLAAWSRAQVHALAAVFTLVLDLRAVLTAAVVPAGPVVAWPGPAWSAPDGADFMPSGPPYLARGTPRGPGRM